MAPHAVVWWVPHGPSRHSGCLRAQYGVRVAGMTCPCSSRSGLKVAMLSAQGQVKPTQHLVDSSLEYCYGVYLFVQNFFYDQSCVSVKL